MAFLSNLAKSTFARGTAAAIALATPVATFTSVAQAQQAQPAAALVSRTSIPMTDVRNAGENSVRLAAAQNTQSKPNVALFGVTKESWPLIRSGLEQAAASGYPVQVIFMGPTNATPSLEVYAHGELQTRAINPNTIAPATLTTLISEVYRQEYPKALASRISYPSPVQENN